MKLRVAALVALMAVALSGCVYKSVPAPIVSERDAQWMSKVPNFQVDAHFERYEIDDPTGEEPGTVVVDQTANFVYFVLPNKKAIRYGAATGSEAFGWTGTATIKRKAEWPRWMPPPDMLKRWPHLQPTAAAGGLSGGPDNPLGARALYLYQGNRDTLYRIHGTNEPDKIGRNVSSGCIRMRNIDVIDLYNRVKMGAKVVVR